MLVSSVSNTLVGIAIILAIIFAFLAVSRLSNGISDPNLITAESNLKAVGWLLVSAIILGFIIILLLVAGFVGIVKEERLTIATGITATLALILGFAIFVLIVIAFVLSLIAFLNINNSPNLDMVKASGAYGFSLATLILMIFILIAFVLNGSFI